ncbi:MAG TPA: hypothetical protein VFV19_05115 [Candidatus Polarisedimenticolaceae bacterium]|nr:hypothetical protein [Candidatus Polarisedimenticolaceae bacterium]
MRPEPIRDRAVEHLRVIRDAMERAGTFTAVPGWGTVVIGVTALVASAAAAGIGDGASWLRLWLVEGFAAGALAVGAIMLKARRLGLPLTSAIARKFALAFLPSLAAGAILSTSLAMHGLGALLPGTWLLLYGAAVVAAGSLSVRLVPLMGTAFMALGAAALIVAPAVPNLFMAAGFGGLHVVFGLLIARKHGG